MLSFSVTAFSSAVSGPTKLFAPFMIDLPFQSLRHVEQVSYERKFSGTRRKRKPFLSVLQTEEERHKEGNNSDEVKNEHNWRPAEERE